MAITILSFSSLHLVTLNISFAVLTKILSVDCDPLSWHFFISKRSSSFLFTYESLVERELIQAVDIIPEETYDHSLLFTQQSHDV